jgi:hypothetical protein
MNKYAYELIFIYVHLKEFWRSFPPEIPGETPHLTAAPKEQSIFWRLLRPEFVRYVCVLICLYICVCMYLCVYLHIYIHIYIHIYKEQSIFWRLLRPEFVRYIYVFVHVYLYIYVYLCMYVCI